ncbi:MAG: hypothetical protein ABW220_02005 [Burkholderiaceae bacterium]
MPLTARKANHEPIASIAPPSPGSAERDMSGPRRRWFPLAGSAGRAAARVRSAAERRAAPIDPLEGPRLALAGRVVTMNDAFEVLADGVIYIDRGSIVAVLPRKSAPPDGFDDVPVRPSGGTIYPGLIELHNHLSYNALPLWDPVPSVSSTAASGPTTRTTAS